MPSPEWQALSPNAATPKLKYQQRDSCVSGQAFETGFSGCLENGNSKAVSMNNS
jgi:hypothetical protein